MADMTPKKEQTLTEKRKCLSGIIDGLNKQYKMKVVGFADDADIAEKLKIKYLRLPSLNINYMIGGGEIEAGLPYGKISVIEGNPDSGKTALLLETIGEEMERNPDFTVAWVESEESLSEEHLELFHIDQSRFIYIPVERKFGAEGCINILETIIASGSINFAFVNSLKCLTPGEEFQKSMEASSTIGLQARFVSKMMRKFTAVLATNEVGLCIVNHLTTQIGGFCGMGDNLTSSCGRAIKYSSMLTIDLRKKSIGDADPISRDEGMKIGATVKKNHCYPSTNPYTKTDYYVIFGKGTDIVLEILDSCIDQGILIKAGAWIREPSLENEAEAKTLENGEVCKWQGKEKFRNYMEENPEYFEYLKSRARGKLEMLDEKEIDDIKDQLEKEDNEMEFIDNTISPEMDDKIDKLIKETKKKTKTKK